MYRISMQEPMGGNSQYLLDISAEARLVYNLDNKEQSLPEYVINLKVEKIVVNLQNK